MAGRRKLTLTPCPLSRRARGKYSADRDLAGEPGHAKVVEDCRARLLAICDPAEVDARAKKRQAELLAAAGGHEAVLERGDLGFTPPPGYPAVFG